MSLRFYFGPSGSGKSYQLYRDIIARSMGWKGEARVGGESAEPGGRKDEEAAGQGISPGTRKRQNFMIVVPDQFTMQTQQELVTMHPCQGIMNIDVLSFGRLSHRILEEWGRGHSSAGRHR